MSSSNNNNTYDQGDSPPHIRLHSTVSEHSRNSINNNISDNSHAIIIRITIIPMILTIIQISTAYVSQALPIAI